MRRPGPSYPRAPESAPGLLSADMSPSGPPHLPPEPGPRRGGGRAMGLTPGVGVMKKKGKEEKRWDMSPRRMRVRPHLGERQEGAPRAPGPDAPNSTKLVICRDWRMNEPSLCIDNPTDGGKGGDGLLDRHITSRTTTHLELLDTKLLDTKNGCMANEFCIQQTYDLLGQMYKEINGRRAYWAVRTGRPGWST